MIGGGEEAPAAAGSSQPLEWKFEQVFGERAAGEEVQEVESWSSLSAEGEAKLGMISSFASMTTGVVAARISTWWRPINGVEVFVRA
uniref:Uncharacterized protein n=1 Tax=Fagus sylvatica TaxID=28930 RepID=A0A2N9H3K1_FAGSY